MQPSSKVSILVVDDNPANLTALRAMLGELGENIVTASSGAEALRCLLEQDFALIILDIRMPDMDGFETAQLIRARDRTRSTPIVFLTAFDRSETQILTAYELGAVDFLQKPIISGVLKSKAAVFVELFRKNVEVRRQGEILREIEKKEHERALEAARERWEADAVRAEMERQRALAEALRQRTEELAQTVTERQRAEEALRESNHRLRLLSETATRLLLGARPNDLVASLFDQLSTHLGLEVHLSFGLNEDSQLRLDSWTGLADTEAQAIRDQVSTEVAGRVAAERRRLVVENVADDPRFLLIAALGLGAFVCYPLLAQGRLMGALFFGTRRRCRFDVDELAVMQVFCDQVAVAMERARLLDELERRAEALAESDRRKDEFLAMLGHELRNPLAPIVSALQIMRLRGDEDEVVTKAHRAMDRQVRHIVRLVDDLLDVSRINSGKIELRREDAQLGTVLDHALSTSRPLVVERGHTLHVSVSDPTARLYVDSIRLSQVISNLLNNAAKYTREGGNVWLSAVVSGDTVEIRVRDDGMGVEPDMLPKVFEMFVQTQRSAGKSQGGLGIGLTLVRRVVELHGGHVTATSGGRGRGSEFVVTLPGVVVEASSSLSPRLATGSMRGATMSSPMAPPSSLRILVVEDNSDIRETLRDLLVMCGHDVQVAEDGESGMEILLSTRPDVALIDIGLPGLDGYHVARAVRDRMPERETRLIALTGYGQPDDRRKAIDAGFDAHLVKPVDLQHLSQILAEQPT